MARFLLGQKHTCPRQTRSNDCWEYLLPDTAGRYWDRGLELIRGDYRRYPRYLLKMGGGQRGDDLPYPAVV